MRNVPTRPLVRAAWRPLRLLALLVLLPAAAHGASPAMPNAVTLDTPRPGEAVLTIQVGTRSKTFTLRQIEALGTYRVRTSTFWPADNGVYEGVLLADLLRAAGVHGVPSVRLVALDGFSQSIPREDWAKWPLIVATRRNGKPISRREKGPLRIIYPRDSDPRLEDQSYRLRWVWMIQRIVATPPKPVDAGMSPAGIPRKPEN